MSTLYCLQSTVYSLLLTVLCLLSSVNRLTAIDANWRQIRRTLKRRGRQMASWIPHLTLMLISREGYQLGP